MAEPRCCNELDQGIEWDHDKVAPFTVASEDFAKLPNDESNVSLMVRLLLRMLSTYTTVAADVLGRTTKLTCLIAVGSAAIGVSPASVTGTSVHFWAMLAKSTITDLLKPEA